MVSNGPSVTTDPIMTQSTAAQLSSCGQTECMTWPRPHNPDGHTESQGPEVVAD